METLAYIMLGAIAVYLIYSIFSPIVNAYRSCLHRKTSKGYFSDLNYDCAKHLATIVATFALGLIVYPALLIHLSCKN